MIDMELLNYLEEFISENRKERFTEILSQRTNYITVAVEDVYQMHNTSAVVRSCESFGVQTAHLIEGKYGKRLDEEIAMGAQKWVDIKRYQNSKEAIDTLKNKGYKIVATSPHANSSLLQDFKLNGQERNKSGVQAYGHYKGVAGMNFIYYAWTYGLAFKNNAKNIPAKDYGFN